MDASGTVEATGDDTTLLKVEGHFWRETDLAGAVGRRGAEPTAARRNRQRVAPLRLWQ